MQRALAGAAAGLLATAPMTLAMKAGQAALAPHERHPLPPRRVTMRALRAVGARPHTDLEEEHRRGLTLAAHYGYGAGAGVLFGLFAPRRMPEAVSAGIGYGLIIWAASYLALMPAVGLHPPATREPRGRNLMMIAAHVVWGATLGASAGLLQSRSSGTTR